MFCFQCLKIGSDIFEESLFSFYWKWIVWLSRMSDWQWAFSIEPKNVCITYVEREIRRVVYNFANYTRIIFISWVIIVFKSVKLSQFSHCLCSTNPQVIVTGHTYSKIIIFQLEKWKYLIHPKSDKSLRVLLWIVHK